MPFTELGLVPELARAVAEQGYDTPTPIQMRAIPAVIAGRDVLAGAQTALARYAIAALDPALQTALGDPTVSDSDSEAPSLRRESPFALNLQIRLPSIRLAMRATSSALAAISARGCSVATLATPPSIRAEMTSCGNVR